MAAAWQPNVLSPLRPIYFKTLFSTGGISTSPFKERLRWLMHYTVYTTLHGHFTMTGIHCPVVGRVLEACCNFKIWASSLYCIVIIQSEKRIKGWWNKNNYSSVTHHFFISSFLVLRVFFFLILFMEVYDLQIPDHSSVLSLCPVFRLEAFQLTLRKLVSKWMHTGLYLVT